VKIAKLTMQLVFDVAVVSDVCWMFKIFVLGKLE